MWIKSESYLGLDLRWLEHVDVDVGRSPGVQGWCGDCAANQLAILRYHLYGRYMRTPQENKQGYDDVNPIARAAQLHGALLICHGLADDNVHYQNTAEYVEALVQADKDFRQLVYTNRNHSIYGGNTRNHLFRQAIDHFNANLK